MTDLGFFLTIEGIDGSGKTEQARRIADRITGAGRPILSTREPTDGPIGSLIRAALTHKVELAPGAMGALFCADRLDHAGREISPALAQGVHVVCDRYDWSNIVYRAAETPGPFYTCAHCGWSGEPGSVLRVGLGAWATPQTCPRCMERPIAFSSEVLERAAWARSLSRGIPIPAVTIVLTVTTQVAESRRRARGGPQELFDGGKMQARCCALYARAPELAATGERIVVVDGMGTPEEVHDRILDELFLLDLALYSALFGTPSRLAG